LSGVLGEKIMGKNLGEKVFRTLIILTIFSFFTPRHVIADCYYADPEITTSGNSTWEKPILKLVADVKNQRFIVTKIDGLSFGWGNMYLIAGSYGSDAIKKCETCVHDSSRVSQGNSEILLYDNFDKWGSTYPKLFYVRFETDVYDGIYTDPECNNSDGEGSCAWVGPIIIDYCCGFDGPQLYDPANNTAKIFVDVNFQWSPVSCNGVFADIYRIQVATNIDSLSKGKESDCNECEINDTTSSTRYFKTLSKCDNKYYWHVRGGKQDIGQGGSWSETWNFTTECSRDSDGDGDGVVDEKDACPKNPNKWANPGQCGCDKADTDSDSDGIADCNDNCPYDRNKQNPGQCGCGIEDIDSDWDGTANCNDHCPDESGPISNDGCPVIPCKDNDKDGYGIGESCQKIDCDDNDKTKYPGAPEICDGKDNQCEGDSGYNVPDEGYDVGAPCSKGVGECKRTGSKMCKSDHSGTECKVDEGTPSDEICDKKDNNCDGYIDEGINCPIFNWKLPFNTKEDETKQDETWYCTCGYGCGLHSGDFYYSLDFDKDRTENKYPVLAIESGEVSFVDESGGFGYVVKIKHGSDYESVYAHLYDKENPYVKVGDWVSQGTQIGRMWKSGCEKDGCGSHIHLMLYYKDKKASSPESRPEPMSGYADFIERCGKDYDCKKEKNSCYISDNKLLDLGGDTGIPTFSIDPILWEVESEINIPVEKIFTILNTGTALLKIPSMYLEGMNNDQFMIISGENNISLEPDESAGITIRFLPTTEGIKQAILVFENNDPGDNPKKINITGKGIVKKDNCINVYQGLVSWWTFDNSSNDILGVNNASESNAINFVPGKVDNGVAFGNDGYIYIPHSDTLENQQFTIEGWMRPDGPGPNDDEFGNNIITKLISGSEVTVVLNWRATPDYRFLFMFGHQNSNELIWSKNQFPPGEFYHIAATYDGNIFKLIINGELEGQVELSTPIIYNDTQWVIGSGITREGNIYYRTWNGIIDEIAIYNRALSQSEIQSIFNANGAGKCKEKRDRCERCYGDINGDCNINVGDQRKVSNAIIDQEYYEIMDLNNDGEINIGDLRPLSNMIIDQKLCE